MRLRWVGWIGSLGRIRSPCPTSWSGAGWVTCAHHADMAGQTQHKGCRLNGRRHFQQSATETDMGNHRKGGKKGRPGASPKSATVLNFNTGRVSGLHQTDPMGASWRAYPRSGLRQGLIDRLNAKPEGERSGDDWWQLGEYQVLEEVSSRNGRNRTLRRATASGFHLAAVQGCACEA